MLTESSLTDLFTSAVTAFPKTTKRQHATHTIVIPKLEWTAFKGMKTLMVRGLAQNEGKEYNQVIVFKKVDFSKDSVRIVDSVESEHSFDYLSMDSTDVLVRCNCPDFRWRFAYYDHLDKSLFGRKPQRYIAKGVCPPANPLEMEGMCKHLMKVTKVLREAGIFKA